jgi:hypothetical protein
VRFARAYGGALRASSGLDPDVYLKDGGVAAVSSVR